jgi:hypothetical protein
MRNFTNYILNQVFEFKYCYVSAKKKHIDDVQKYCVNLSTFLLNAMKNHLKFNNGNYGFLHESEVSTQFGNNMKHVKL